MTGSTSDAMAADDWVETEPGWQPAEQVALDRLALLDEVVHPVRGALIRRLRQARTVGELAELMDVPVTRLYHHVNRLEADGLIRVEATRRVGGVTERRYRSTARRFELDPALFEHAEPTEVGRAIGGLFDMAKSAMQREFELGAFTGRDLEGLAMLSLAELKLTEARRAELMNRLGDLFEEFAATDATTDAASNATSPTRLFLVAFPVTP